MNKIGFSLKFNWIISNHSASDELHVGKLQTKFWSKFLCWFSQDLAAEINLDEIDKSALLIAFMSKLELGRFGY